MMTDPTSQLLPGGHKDAVHSVNWGCSMSQRYSTIAAKNKTTHNSAEVTCESCRALMVEVSLLLDTHIPWFG